MLFNYFSIKQPTGLAPILAHWGVNTLPDVVQEHDPKNTTSGEDVVIYNFSSHPVVNPLTGLALELVLPRPIGVVDSQNQAADAPNVEALVYSSPQSTLVGDPAAPPRAYPLMVAVEQKAVPGVASTRGNTRMVVVGDSFFLDNQMIAAAANRDFAGYAVNWLLNRTTLLKGIGPRPVTEYRLLLTQAQQVNVRWLLLGALPGAVLLFGWNGLVRAQKIMNTKSTWIWFVVAAMLAAFIFIFQHYFNARRKRRRRNFSRLAAVRVTSVQIIPAGALEIRADRVNGSWLLTKPISYPAQSAAIEALLAALQKLAPAKISPEELRGHTNPDAEFGFDNPQTTLVIGAGDKSWQLKVGKMTAPGDQVYLRVGGMDWRVRFRRGLAQIHSALGHRLAQHRARGGRAE